MLSKRLRRPGRLPGVSYTGIQRYSLTLCTFERGIRFADPIVVGDRILRDDEQTIVVARYILENPVRAGLVEGFDEYPYSGSTKCTISELADAIQSLR